MSGAVGETREEGAREEKRGGGKEEDRVREGKRQERGRECEKKALCESEPCKRRRVGVKAPSISDAAAP